MYAQMSIYTMVEPVTRNNNWNYDLKVYICMYIFA